MASAQCSILGAPGITFSVQDVESNRDLKRRVSQTALKMAWEAEAGGPVWAHSQFDSANRLVSIFDEYNSFAAMVNDSFYNHYPLDIRPDDIWLAIMQGFSIHVREHSERLRGLFVQHDGKRELEVTLPNNTLEDMKTIGPWPDLLASFCRQIAQSTKDEFSDHALPSFSTSTLETRVAFNVALMDSVQEYFSYKCYIGCGIPRITLSGTVADWQVLREAAEYLGKYDLDWWLSELLPVLDEFVSAAKGSPTKSFWASINNFAGGSGWAQPITGWLSVLYPYIYSPSDDHHHFDGGHLAMVRNKYISCWRHDNSEDNTGERKWPGGAISAPALHKFPSGINAVPILLHDLMDTNVSKTTVLVCSGFVGYSQGSDGTLRAEIGWAVVQSEGVARTGERFPQCHAI